MPKKPTKTRERNQASKVVEGEGAPPPSSFNLGDFVAALPRGQPRGSEPAAPPAPAPAPPPAPALVGVWGQPKPSTLAPAPTPATAPASVPTAPPPASHQTAPYTIGKTKKGGLPVRVESRNKGKKVTVVFNVTGDLKLLLSELKQAAGSGGVVREDTLEIQGDKQTFVE